MQQDSSIYNRLWRTLPLLVLLVAVLITCPVRKAIKIQFDAPASGVAVSARAFTPVACQEYVAAPSAEVKSAVTASYVPYSFYPTRNFPALQDGDNGSFTGGTKMSSAGGLPLFLQHRQLLI